MTKEQIDIVYTWCDGNDPKFQKERSELCKKLGIPEESDNDQLNVERRHRNNNELLYSLRSVEKYAPWVHHIFIITNNQRPEWLNDNPKITIVNQNDIIPNEILPVFNSVAIEQYITNIPELSEHFIYLNDDMFFNRAVSPSTFFRNGKPVVWRLIPPRQFDFSQSDWEKTLLNAYLLFLTKNYSYYQLFLPHHGIEAYSKSMLKEILLKYPETYEKNSSPFRNIDNIQRILWAYEMAYIHGCPIKNDYSSVNKIYKRILCIFRLSVFWNLELDPHNNFNRFKLTLYLRQCYSFCINDLSDIHKSQVIRYLERRFSKKSSFEK